MLELLKKDLIMQEQTISATELMLESAANDDVRDAFLDDTELTLLGVENDPKIAKQVEDIPESDEFGLSKDEMKELENLEESVAMIPEA